MSITDQITTVKSFSESIFKEKGSRFIGRVYPIEFTENFNDILSSVKKQFFDASHYCYAYRLLNDEFKYSDAGEPNGTAGIRILNAIDHFSLTNVMVIVTRYFGGTKLGIGPLGKAYYNSAEMTIKSAEKITKTAFQKVIIESDFSFTSLMHKTFSDFEMKVTSTEYEKNVKFVCIIKPRLMAKFQEYLTDKTHGSVKILVEEKINYL